MINFSTVISTLTDTLFRRRTKLQILGENDLQNVYDAMPFGDDGHPPTGLKAIYAQTSTRGKAILIGYINIHQLEELAKGEKRIYSTDEDGEALSSYIRLKNDGTAEFLGTGDFLTRFGPTEQAFNSLQQTVDDLVTAYNSHVHITTATIGPGPSPGVISPTTSTATPSTADISGAKIAEAETL